jgi:hypothetical protein
MLRRMHQISSSPACPAAVPVPLVQAGEMALPNPLFGIFFTLVGLLFASLALPSDIVQRGAVKWSATIMAISLAAVPLIAAAARPKSIFRAEHILVLSPIFWLLLDVMQGRYYLDGLEPHDVRVTFATIACMVIGVWISAMHRPWGVPGIFLNATNFELTDKLIFRTAVLSFVIAFSRFAIPCGFDLSLMFSSLGGGRWAAPWSRGALGGVDAFLDHLSYFGYALPVLTVVLARRLGWVNVRTIVIGLCALMITAFLSAGGGRRIIGVMYGGALLYWLLSRPKIRFINLLGVAVAAFSLLAVLELMLDYRNVGYGAMFDRGTSGHEVKVGSEDEVMLRVDDNFLRLGEITNIIPDYHEYVTWRYPLWVLARPIPRLFWPNKPLDPGFDLPNFLGKEGVSLSCSVIGELYMAGGFMAILFGGWLYGRLAGILSRMMIEQRNDSALIIYSIGLLALFAGMRSMIELVLMSYAMFAWVGLVTLSRRSLLR